MSEIKDTSEREKDKGAKSKQQNNKPDNKLIKQQVAAEQRTEVSTLQKTLAVFFALSLFVVFIVVLAKPVKTFSYQERRPLETFPEFSWQGLSSGDYFTKLSKAWSDQFIGREKLLGLKASVQKNTGIKDNSRVYFADKDYLIELHPDLDAKQLQNNLSDMDNFYQENFSSKPDFKEGRILLAPTVAAVAPELLPANAPEADQKKILEDISEQRTGDDLELLDVLEDLENAKLAGRDISDLYFRTDHHWTQTGAKVAADKILSTSDLCPAQDFEPEYSTNVVSENFRGTTWAKANVFGSPADQIISYENPDLAKVKLFDEQNKLIREGVYNQQAIASADPYEYFLGQNTGYIKLETGSNYAEARGRKLLVFKDSYANALIPFLCPYYESITVIDLRYYPDSIKSLITDNDYTDLLFAYNIVTLSADNNVYKLLK